jgi:hypothetical protein
MLPTGSWKSAPSAFARSHKGRQNGTMSRLVVRAHGPGAVIALRWFGVLLFVSGFVACGATRRAADDEDDRRRGGEGGEPASGGTAGTGGASAAGGLGGTTPSGGSSGSPSSGADGGGGTAGGGASGGMAGEGASGGDGATGGNGATGGDAATGGGGGSTGGEGDSCLYASRRIKTTLPGLASTRDPHLTQNRFARTRHRLPATEAACKYSGASTAT